MPVIYAPNRALRQGCDLLAASPQELAQAFSYYDCVHRETYTAEAGIHLDVLETFRKDTVDLLYTFAGISKKTIKLVTLPLQWKDGNRVGIRPRILGIGTAGDSALRAYCYLGLFDLVAWLPKPQKSFLKVTDYRKAGLWTLLESLVICVSSVRHGSKLRKSVDLYFAVQGQKIEVEAMHYLLNLVFNLNSLERRSIDTQIFRAEAKEHALRCAAMLGREEVSTWVRTAEFPVTDAKFESLLLMLPLTGEEKRTVHRDWVKHQRNPRFSEVSLRTTFKVGFNSRITRADQNSAWNVLGMEFADGVRAFTPMVELQHFREAVDLEALGAYLDSLRTIVQSLDGNDVEWKLLEREAVKYETLLRGFSKE